jgi:hypothetical protein
MVGESPELHDGVLYVRLPPVEFRFEHVGQLLEYSLGNVKPNHSIPGHVQQAQRGAAKVQSGDVNVGIEGGRQHYCPSSIRRARTTSETWSSVMPDTRPYPRPRSRVACHDRSRRRSRSSLAATSSTEMPSDEAIGSSSASKSGGRYVLLPFVATTLLSHAAAARPSRFRFRSRFHLHA